LAEFLQRLDLERYEDLHDRRADKGTLMTMHGAKGLEVAGGFLAGGGGGMVPGFPGGPPPPTPLPPDGRSGAEIEEERRLFYVGMTRARRRLYLSWAASRFLFGERLTNQPSPFLGEIPDSLVARVTELTPHDYRRVQRRRPRQRKLFLS